MHKILSNSSTLTKISYLFLLMLTGAFMASSLTSGLSGFFSLSHNSVLYYRLMLLNQNIIMFFLPAYTLTTWSTAKPLSSLRLQPISNYWRTIPITILIYLFTIPVISWIGEWNKQINFPDSLTSLENSLIEIERAAAQTIHLLTKDKSIVNLMTNILIIGAITAFVEEMFFRGVLQQLIEKGTSNIHISVWTTAFIFSALHFQFYGFIPRLLLGAILGYLFTYSRNLWLPIIFHFINNSVVLIMIHFDVSDIVTEKFNQSPPVLSISLVLAGLIITLFLYRQLKLISKKYDTN